MMLHSPSLGERLEEEELRLWRLPELGELESPSFRRGKWLTMLW